MISRVTLGCLLLLLIGCSLGTRNSQPDEVVLAVLGGLSDPITTQHVGNVLDRCGIGYRLGGSRSTGVYVAQADVEPALEALRASARTYAPSIIIHTDGPQVWIGPDTSDPVDVTLDCPIDEVEARLPERERALWRVLKDSPEMNGALRDFPIVHAIHGHHRLFPASGGGVGHGWDVTIDLTMPEGANLAGWRRLITVIEDTQVWSRGGSTWWFDSMRVP